MNLQELLEALISGKKVYDVRKNDGTYYKMSLGRINHYKDGMTIKDDVLLSLLSPGDMRLYKEYDLTFLEAMYEVDDDKTVCNNITLNKYRKINGELDITDQNDCPTPLIINSQEIKAKWKVVEKVEQ